MARARKSVPRGGVPLTPAVLESLARDLENGSIKADTVGRLVVSDSVQPGLRAIIRKSGTTLHAQYTAPDGSRPYIKIMDYTGAKSIAEARKLVATLVALSERGLDPLENLRQKVMAEILEKGTAWRP